MEPIDLQRGFHDRQALAVVFAHLIEDVSRLRWQKFQAIFNFVSLCYKQEKKAQTFSIPF